MEKIKLKNGINLFLIPDDKFTTMRVDVIIHRPLEKKEATINNLISMLFRCGGKKYPSRMKLNVESEKLYGTSLYTYSAKIGEENIVCIGFDILSKSTLPEGIDIFSGASELLFDVFFSPREIGFKKQDIKSEKENLIKKIEAERNNKISYSTNRLLEEMCHDEPYGVNTVGYTDIAKKISEDDIINQYNTLLDNSVIDIMFTGNFSKKDATDFSDKFVKNLNDRDASIIKGTYKEPGNEIKKVKEKMDVTQGKLCMGFRVPVLANDDKMYAAWLATVVFGGGATSKLFNNVREKMSLCYYASASYDKHKGIILVKSGIECENFKKAYDGILFELENIKNGVITDEEFDGAKKTLVTALKAQNDSLYSILNKKISNRIAGTDLTADDEIKKINSLTKENIVEAANLFKLDTVYFLDKRRKNKWNLKNIYILQ